VAPRVAGSAHAHDAVVFDDPSLGLRQGEKVKTAIADLLTSHTAAGDEVWLVSPTVGLGRGATLPGGESALLRS
jgi:hypothetical protein